VRDPAENAGSKTAGTAEAAGAKSIDVMQTFRCCTSLFKRDPQPACTAYKVLNVIAAPFETMPLAHLDQSI